MKSKTDEKLRLLTEVRGDEVLAVLHDEDTSDVQLDVVLRLLVLEHVERSALWYEQESAELELSFDAEVLYGEVILPVVAERLVELTVLVSGDVVSFASPQRLGLVQLFLFYVHLLRESARCFIKRLHNLYASENA